MCLRVKNTLIKVKELGIIPWMTIEKMLILSHGDLSALTLNATKPLPRRLRRRGSTNQPPEIGNSSKGVSRTMRPSFLSLRAAPPQSEELHSGSVNIFFYLCSLLCKDHP